MPVLLGMGVGIMIGYMWGSKQSTQYIETWKQVHILRKYDDFTYQGTVGNNPDTVEWDMCEDSPTDFEQGSTVDYLIFKRKWQPKLNKIMNTHYCFTTAEQELGYESTWDKETGKAIITPIEEAASVRH